MQPADPAIRAALEAVLMVVDEPISAAELAATLEVPQREAEDALEELAAEYARQGRGFELRAVAGGWRFYSRPEYADIVSRYVLEGQTARLTQAALETLAVIAYRQPVGRSRVAAIRGVNVDSVVKTLVTRGLVEEAGTDPESGAILYRTTSYFLERLGIGSVAELPQLSPHLPGLDELGGIDAPF
jgi:segregation and condensation protein B